jgi:uncharacterized protein
MILRRQAATVEAALARQPAVALLGPRQVGKTTLALALVEGRPSVYLDLESEADRAKLVDAESYLAAHEDKLVVLDEVQRRPELFQVLRGLIDRGRRRGRRTGRFLLLGSASLELLRQSSESLAGRLAQVELGPVDVTELDDPPAEREALWLRGGFPDSLLAPSDELSLGWRQDFLRTYLERDVPQLGPRLPAETLRRLWTMLAHGQAGLLNAARLAAGLGISGQTVARYTDLLVDLLLVRRLEPVQANVGKRLVKSPKVFVRDSGIVHALLGIETREQLLGHPVAPPRTLAGFYRTSAGAELDLVLDFPGKERWAVEVKRGAAPAVERGFHHSRADLQSDRCFVVHSGEERYPMGDGVEAIPREELARELRARA